MMKYLTCGLAVLPSIIAAEATTLTTPPHVNKIERAITSLNPNTHQSRTLAAAIGRCSTKGQIPWQELVAIAAVESNFNPKAIRKVSGRGVDFGLFQLNVKTITHYKLDKTRLTEVHYNTEAACKVITDIRKIRKNWHGYYNVGPHSKNNTKRHLYETKVKTKLATLNKNVFH